MMLTASALAADSVRIAALGDSLVQGYGLPLEDGLVPQMNNRLSDMGYDVTIVNAGVSGDTTAGGAARIRWTLDDQIDGLIVLLGGNDLLRGISPVESRRNLTLILDAARARELPVLLIGHEAVANYGPDYKAAFESIYTDLADAYGILLHERIFDAIDIEADRARARRDYLQPDGLHPNRQGVALIVDALSPKLVRLIEQAMLLPGQTIQAD